MPSGVPPYLAALYEVPLLTRPQERHLFRKMNYLKYRATRLRRTLDPLHPAPALLDDIETSYAQAVEIRSQIVRANLRLVVALAKRRAGPKVGFFELVSDGNMTLFRAVAKFDYARGFRFSTYATWAIIKSYATRSRRSIVTATGSGRASTQC